VVQPSSALTRDSAPAEQATRAEAPPGSCGVSLN
jgi:hypothetical protein